MSPSRIVAAALAMIALTAALLTGCTPDQPTGVTSVWPQADSERSHPRPPGLVRWPLTGMPAPDEVAAGVRAVSVKIENSAASRPQSNLYLADVVYESLTEGGITRFNAIFHSSAPEVVGPVRSLSDVYIVPQYGALFAHVGGNSGVISRVKAADIDDLDQFANPGPYWRSSARPRPHNMYTSIPQLRDLGESRGFATEQTIQSWVFELLPQEATPTVTEVSVPFAPGNTATWKYDAGDDVYARETNGRVHGDAVSGEQYTARNVIVVWALTTAAAKRDVVGSTTLDIELNGRGRVSVFRNGLRFDGEWETGGTSPPRLTSEDGGVIRLAPGNTWVQVIPSTGNITMK